MIRFQTAGKTFFCFFLVLLVFSGCLSLPVSGTSLPITQNGKMSGVTLALVERQNFIQNKEQKYIYPDGLVFYFVISPSGDHINPTIRESQNFTVDGKIYWQSQTGSIDSYTVLYSPKTFAQEDPEAAGKIAITENPNVIIQKTVICGERLPVRGTVRYPFYFGFEQKLEKFEFLFRLQDVL